MVVICVGGWMISTFYYQPLLYTDEYMLGGKVYKGFGEYEVYIVIYCVLFIFGYVVYGCCYGG